LTVWGVFSQDPIAQSAKSNATGNVERSYNFPTPKVILLNAWVDRLELHDLVHKVAASCKRYKVDKLLIENKAAGISVSQEIRRLYANEDFAVQLVEVGSQDKMARLYSVQHLFSEEMVYAPDRTWADLVITQCANFPKAKHDDLVDTVSQGLRHLRSTGILQRSQEIQSELYESMKFTGSPPEPLYPV
jgi:predicted phage terminase large subunit-like protein